MNKIIILVGISGSGKSTFAKGYVKNHRDTVIISRDTIRMSLFGFNEETYGDYYKDDVTEREKIVTNFFNSQLSYALEKGLDVIADNTHLNTSYIYAYKQFGVPLEIRIFDTSEDGCILRDLSRVKCVGEDVIKKQYKSFQKLKNSNFREEVLKYNEELLNIYATCKKTEYDEDKPDCICVDIDGTIAHTNGKRSPYDYSKVSVDDVDEAIRDIVFQTGYSGRISIVVCSGREDICKTDTQTWLYNNHIFPTGLFMRKAGDNRKDNIVKAELWRDIQKEYNIIAMFDDRNRVVNMARNLGYKVCQVENGDF